MVQVADGGVFYSRGTGLRVWQGVMNRASQLLIYNLLLAVWLVAGYSASAWGDEPMADSDGPLFYPLPPNAPRLQFLASYRSELDVSAESEGGFRDFLFGGRDKESTFINKPYGVAIHKGAIHVVDTRGNGWGVFDIANSRAFFVRPSGGGRLAKPINITIDTDGTKYVTDTDREQIVVYGPNNRYIKAFGEPGQFKPIDVAIAEDRLFVTDAMNHKVHILDKQSGETLFTIGESGSKKGQLLHPTNIAIASDGSVYVVDTTNSRVQKFSPDGEFMNAFGGAGAVPGRFTRPKGIAIDQENHLYVTDAAFNNVQVLDDQGGALMFFGGQGAGPDSLDMLTAIGIDYESVPYFEHLAAPGFDIEYLVVVAGQFGINKAVVYGYGSFDE
jgi:sugar lactone lactonase YvrE